MKAILTVVGNDKVGIIAKVSQKLMEENINILDVSQTILGTNFTMMMLIDMGGISSDFSQIQTDLSQLGEDLSLRISLQREDIFNAMHQL